MSRTCAYAQVRPSLFASVSVPEVLGCSVSPCRSQWDFDGHVVFVPTTVLNESHSTLDVAQDIELQRETCCSCRSESFARISDIHMSGLVVKNHVSSKKVFSGTM